MYMTYNELIVLHEQRVKDLGLQYRDSVRQQAEWGSALGSLFQRIGLWFEQLGRRMQSASERNPAANQGADALTPGRVRSR